MTTQEISNKLDIELDHQGLGIALNEYYKSMYLTQAQSSFVDHVLAKYEYGDRIRHILGKLLKEEQKVETDVVTTGDGYTVLTLPSDLRQIVFEATNNSMKTIPMDFNDIHDTVDNPFREPASHIAYRVTFDNQMRLYTSEVFVNYQFIYCKEPQPIVLEDLPNNLTVHGVSTDTTSELPDASVLQVIQVASNLIYKDRSRFAPKQTSKT